MKFPSSYIELLSAGEMQLIHEKSLALLASPGIMIDHEGFLKALEARGARVDYSTRVVQLPTSLAQEAAVAMAGDTCLLKSSETAVAQAVAEGIAASRCKPLSFGLGGASLEVLDDDARVGRAATYHDLERIVRFGNGHPRITEVGNPVLSNCDAEGRAIPPALRSLYTMTYMAKHCIKLAYNEVWNARDVIFAVKLGELVLGAEAYARQPIFLSVKCSISPLKIDSQSAETLFELATRGLPVGLVPMPISGASAPVTPAAGILITNAEILGLAAALWAVGSQSPQGHGILASVLNMRSALTSYSNPNSVSMDIGLFQLHQRMYGRNVMAATDYVDAKYPGVQSALDRALKIASLAAAGSFFPGIGQLDAGMICSPVQACLDIDAFDWMHRFLQGFEVSEKSLCVNLIREKGIGGNFLDADHTFEHFKEELPMPLLVDLAARSEIDLLEAAKHEANRIITETPVYTRDKDLCEAADALLRKAGEQWNWSK
jgi:trimethylamine---corrinoid protein Co-methyltransferase